MAERNLDKEFDALKGDIGKLREDIATLASSIGAIAGEQAGATGAKVREGAEYVRTQAGEAAARGRARAEQGAQAVEHQIEEHPFTSVAVAFGLGMVVGRLMSR